MLFFFQAEDGIRDWSVTGVQTCALPIYPHHDGEEHHQLGLDSPGARLVPVGPLEFVDEGIEVECHGAYPFFAASFAGGLPASLASVAVRLSERLRSKSETRRLSTLLALTSTSSGSSSQGEASILRMRVETRAFDCA